LSKGIGLIVIDVVTSRKGNLHNELVDLMDLEASWHMPAEQTTYTIAYRPVREGGIDRIETWPIPLAVGEGLPTMPLSLEAELCVPVDLEAVYTEACQRRRLDEALGINSHLFNFLLLSLIQPVCFPGEDGFHQIAGIDRAGRQRPGELLRCG
jgi:hypothetical protein